MYTSISIDLFPLLVMYVVILPLISFFNLMFIQHINSAHHTLPKNMITVSQFSFNNNSYFSLNNSVAVIQSPGGSVTSAYIYTQLRATVNPAKELNTVKDKVDITCV